ncbi:LacI family DNA-binding transcriptional regulator [Arachidicoccus sp.]|uniref:LacI family DNA-binding transcriptional regulator n=1 Tax=Arachidicoccus sp. TaxID=1872624 RepID=UPI003D220604
MQKRKSINDIAKDLNVAISTVSAVLNGKAEERRISIAMTEKVLQYAKEIGYKPNMIARSLRTGKSNIIGMLVEDISDPFFASIARLVEKNAAFHNYKLFYSSTENNATKAKGLIRAFRDQQVDAYIIAPTPGIEKEIQLLLNEKIPLVLFDRFFPNILTDNVVADNFGGALNATNHLIKNGYKHIGFITLNSKQKQMIDRLDGYLEAMNLQSRPSYINQIDYLLSEEILQEKIEQYLEKNPQLDAVFFATNYLAISGLRALKKMKVEIPNDIAVLGFDDNTHFNLFTPSITSVAQPIEKISEEIVRILMKNIKTEMSENERENVVLQTELIVRESSAKL